MLGFILNIPYTVIGLAIGLISFPASIKFRANPYTFIFAVKKFWWVFGYMKHARAMAIGQVVLLEPKLEDKDLEHELVHVQQYQRAPLIHPILYYIELLRKGYKNNKYEIEAYKVAGNIYRDKPKMKIYLIEGVSGTGKTTVCEELNRRGYKAIEADEEIAHYADPKTGLPTNEKVPDNWLWNKDKFDTAVKQEGDDPIFICGGAMNQEEFKHHFAKVFTLHMDDETLKHRLASRTNNDFGKHPDELALQLEWNKGAIKYSKERGTTLIDATKPVSDVVDEILSYADAS